MRNSNPKSMLLAFRILLAMGIIIISAKTQGQVEWPVSDSISEIISFSEFDQDRIDEGRIIYNRSCASCHGNPGQANYAILIPSPGDPVDARFQDQTDGALFHKIQAGRELMPAFSTVFGDDEIWSIIAFFRSFNPSYEQPKPDLTGIYIPELTLETSFDPNIDKIVVKVFDRGLPAEGVNVKAYLIGTFGNYLLDDVISNENGISYFHVDDQMPGDSEGNKEVLIRAKMGYASIKQTETIQMLKPFVGKNPISGRHIWSTGNKAPYWLYFAFFGTLFLIWGGVIYVIVGLSRLKKIQ